MLRLDSANGSGIPNLIGGSSFNNVTGGAIGVTITGGGEPSHPNMITASTGAIGGGRGNTTSGFAATIPGGNHNTAGGAYSFAAGHRANAAHDGAFVWSDSSSTAFMSTGVGIGTNAPESALHIKDGELRVSHGSSGVDIVLEDDANGSEWILRHDRGNDLLEFRHDTGGARVEIGDGNMGVGFTYTKRRS